MRYHLILLSVLLCACGESNNSALFDYNEPIPKSPRFFIESNIQDLEKVYHLLDKKACQKIQKKALDQLDLVERTILSARIMLNNGHALSAQKKLASIAPNALNPTQLEAYLNTFSLIHQYRNQLKKQIADEIQLEQLTDLPTQRLWQHLGIENQDTQDTHQPIVDGWLKLNELLGPSFSTAKLQTWFNEFPDHPAQQSIHPLDLAPEIKTIILALPISSKQINHFESIQKGFLATYMSDLNPKKPTLTFIDTNTEPFESISQSIKNEQTTWVIGSFNAQQAKSLTHAHPALRILNIDENKTAGPNAYTLGENPDYSSQHLAWHAMNMGYDHALFITYNDDKNINYLKKIRNHWTLLGGETTDVIHLDPQNENNIMAKSLGINLSKKRALDLKSIIKKSFHFIPNPRDDYDVVFLIMSPHQIKTVNPLLNYYFSTRAPRFASTLLDAHHTLLKKDKDLDEVIFPNDAYISLKSPLNSWVQTTQNTLKKGESKKFDRYHSEYSTGINSYLFIKYFEAFKHMPKLLLPSSSGKMTLHRNHVFHHVNWLTFKNGHLIEDVSSSS